MTEPGYDYWLLDLDGTLVDTEWSYTREVFDRVEAELGVSFTDYEAEVLWHGLGGDRDDLLREWGYDPVAFWEVFDALDDPVERAEATYLYDDASFVADLDTPVGLVTHCPAPATDAVLERLDVRDWFDVVVACDDETGYKPSARPLDLARGDLGVAPAARGVYAGDGASDVGAAANAGLDSIHVERHDPHRRGVCVLGDRRVESFADLGVTHAADD
ncbi:HAD family hydrolase [Halarchaeum sp. CBA1220]|uniref:HAD family hydrolase n=1 Tax=Halarchaeum sp. CBA1220 TaxID=1853682 RepID=UPI000F3A9A5F|nr:HAD family hydrolase [Halarchaeum sp. CBA1220]QLC32879.1 HAD family hydrolase [Halarchaeum sp. CBA1220]